MKDGLSRTLGRSLKGAEGIGDGGPLGVGKAIWSSEGGC
jgi:hypothetical protein